jgi:hypothetical protein
MPTWKGMFTARRAPVTLCALIACVCAPSVAWAGPTTTTRGSTPTTTAPTTSTTVPAPPPAFGLPTDFGFQLVQQQQQAKADLSAAQSAMPGAKAVLEQADRSAKRVRAQLKKLSATAQRNARKLDASRAHLRIVAARAYMHANAADLAAAISSITNATSAVDAASHLHLITTYGNSEKAALDEYVSLKKRLDRQVTEISDLRDRTEGVLKRARTTVNDLQHTIDGSVKKLTSLVTGIKAFEASATSASSPILGPSRLSANQMADYITSQGYKPRITVPIRDLAQMYLEEGNKTGVRGDVAFAQSILETAGFANPGSAATDNNFAGIGWCDSCAHGYNFPDARTGVRAQVQLLRIYVDPFFPVDDPAYKDPILLPGTLKLGFRGKVQTWWDLWGTWATGALYGQRVYDIYEKMVFFGGTDPAQPPQPIASELKPPDPHAPPTTVGRPANSGPGTKSTTP